MKNRGDSGMQIDPMLMQLSQTSGLINTQGDPRYPPLNPLNTMGYEPGVVPYMSPNRDTTVAVFQPGLQRLESMQQLVGARQGLNSFGDPALGLPQAVAEGLGGMPSVAGTAAIGYGKNSLLPVGTDTGAIGMQGRNVRRKR